MKKNSTEYEQALYDARRDPEIWIAQAGNLIGGVFRVFGAWVLVTVVLTVCLLLLSMIVIDPDTLDPTAYSMDELQSALRWLVIYSGMAAAVTCMFVNAGRFRWVLSQAARDKMRRSSAVRDAICTQEAILVHHGLIRRAECVCEGGSAQSDRLDKQTPG